MNEQSIDFVFYFYLGLSVLFLNFLLSSFGGFFFAGEGGLVFHKGIMSCSAE